MTAPSLVAGMRVAGAVRVRVPLRRPMVTSRGTWSVCDSWLVRVVDGDGRSGVGEATLGPFADASRQVALDAQVRALVGASDATPDTSPEGVDHPVAGALAAALDGGMLDLGVSSTGQPRAARVAVNALVAEGSTGATVAGAQAAVAAGFRTLKLKAGGERSTADLVGCLEAVRAAVGPEVALRLDVNGAWDVATAVERLLALAAAGVVLEYVEQPVERDLAAVRAAMAGRMAVAADESVTGLRAVRRLLAEGAADALVVKPGRVGGPRAALAIAAEAAEAGVPVTVSTLLETGVGLMAAIVTASLLPRLGAPVGPGTAHGLGTGGLLVDDLVGGRATCAGGEAIVPPAPGPGIAAHLDGAAVERHAVEVVGAWR